MPRFEDFEEIDEAPDIRLLSSHPRPAWTFASSSSKPDLYNVR
jgi:hypothetical protein